MEVFRPPSFILPFKSIILPSGAIKPLSMLALPFEAAKLPFKVIMLNFEVIKLNLVVTRLLVVLVKPPLTSLAELVKRLIWQFILISRKLYLLWQSLQPSGLKPGQLIYQLPLR